MDMNKRNTRGHFSVPENWDVTWHNHPPPTPLHSVECRLLVRFHNGKSRPITCTLHGADFLPSGSTGIVWEQRTKLGVEKELQDLFLRWLGAA